MKIEVEQITRNVSVNVTTNSLIVKKQALNVSVSNRTNNVTVENNTRNHSVDIVNSQVKVNKPIRNVEVNQVGRRGLKGDAGQDGRVTEVLAGEGIIVDNADVSKPVISATGGSGDKTYTQDFTMQHTVYLSHGLQKLPAVTVINSAGDKLESTVRYVDINNVIVQFTAPFSGRVTLN